MKTILIKVQNSEIEEKINFLKKKFNEKTATKAVIRCIEEMWKNENEKNMSTI